MVKPLSVQKFGNDLLVRLDDGSRWRAIESTGDMFLVSARQVPPVPPPPVGNRFVFPATLDLVTSEFGPRNGRLHAGMDFAGGMASNGQPMQAASAGKVTVAGSHSGYGNTVVLDHGQGLLTLYAHMQWDSLVVGVGQTVAQHQKLGLIGNTGNSFGAHIHFETHEGGYRWDASARDPRIFIPKWNK